MTQCARCGADDMDLHLVWHGGGSTWACGNGAACALRAELRIVKAERDALLVRVADWCAAAAAVAAWKGGAT